MRTNTTLLRCILNPKTRRRSCCLTSTVQITTPSLWTRTPGRLRPCRSRTFDSARPALYAAPTSRRNLPMIHAFYLFYRLFLTQYCFYKCQCVCVCSHHFLIIRYPVLTQQNTVFLSIHFYVLDVFTLQCVFCFFQFVEKIIYSRSAAWKTSSSSVTLHLRLRGILESCNALCSQWCFERTRSFTITHNIFNFSCFDTNEEMIHFNYNSVPLFVTSGHHHELKPLFVQWAVRKYSESRFNGGFWETQVSLPKTKVSESWTDSFQIFLEPHTEFPP